MSFILQAVKYKPVGLFSMDDTTPLQDYSPFNRTATYTGTPSRHPALVHGAVFAPILKSSSVAQFTIPVFVQGTESQSFSLMATTVVVNPSSTGPVQILGHDSQMDGLVIDGTVVSFSTKYLTTGVAKCSFDLQSLSSVQVVGIHTQSKNSLVINGVVVAEVNITSAQRNDSYVASDGKLYSGQTASSRGIAINGVAFFDYALTNNIFTTLFNESHNMPSGSDVVTMFDGERLAMSREASDIFCSHTWSTTIDWYAGHLSGASVRNGQLVPQFSSGVSLPGKWYDSFSLSATDATSIYGVSFDWNGQGAVVEASLDGVAWTSVNRNVNISIIPPGFNPTGKQIIVRVSFPGGITDDTSYLDSLTITGVKTAVSSTWSGHTITLSGAFQQRTSEVENFDALWGTKIDSGGSITITPNSNGNAPVVRTIELWIRAEDSSAAVNVTGTYYQVGIPATATLPIGQWTLFHIVAGANVTGNIVISGAAQVGQVGLYATALTAAQIATISSAYSGANTLSISDISVIGVSEPPSSVDIYAHNWSILSAG